MLAILSMLLAIASAIAAIQLVDYGKKERKKEREQRWWEDAG